jgi:hypothetical protein
LAFGGCQLAFGGCQLAFGGCQLAFGGCQLAFGGCQLLVITPTTAATAAIGGNNILIPDTSV